MSNILCGFGGYGHEEESLLEFIFYFLILKIYSATWEEAVKLNGYFISRIDKLTAMANQNMCNINREQM